jgi:hypothetical protein
MAPRSLGASLTAYRLRAGDEEAAAPAVPVVIEKRPDRLNKNIAYFDFILVGIRATGNLRGENMAASLRSTRSVAKAVLSNRMGRIRLSALGGYSNGKRERAGISFRWRGLSPILAGRLRSSRAGAPGA